MDGARRGVYLVYLLLPELFPLALVTRSGIPNPSRTNSQLYATAVCVYDGLMAEGRGGEVGWIDGAMQCNGQ